MAQFQSFNTSVEVNGETVLAFINSMERGKDTRKAILASHGIDPQPNSWYKKQDYLNAFKEVAESVGEMNLFLIGKAVIDHAKLPPISNLKEALGTIDIGYHMNHRIGNNVLFDPVTGRIKSGIGNYKLISYDEKARKAVMKCINPYPSKFDEGILTQLVRRFKPADSISQKVELDMSQETRIEGKESCTFKISW